MDFGDQLRRYFRTTDFATLKPEAVVVGVGRMSVDFGLAGDRSHPTPS